MIFLFFFFTICSTTLFFFDKIRKKVTKIYAISFFYVIIRSRRLIMEKRKIENIKTIAIIVLALIVVFGGSYFASELKNCEVPSSEESEPEELAEIGIDEYLSYLNGSEKEIIYVGRPGCTYCQQQKPIMEDIQANYDVDIHYLNIDNLDSDGLDRLINSDDYFSGQWGTPVTLIVQNGEVVDLRSGLTTEDNMVSFFKDNGLISE